MESTITNSLSIFLSTKILKQPSRIITREELLISSGLIDSLSLVDLAIFVEESFAVRIEDTELNASTFDTLEQLTALIEQRRT